MAVDERSCRRLVVLGVENEKIGELENHVLVPFGFHTLVL